MVDEFNQIEGAEALVSWEKVLMSRHKKAACMWKGYVATWRGV